VGGAALLWSYPRLFAFAPRDWQVTRQEAEAIGLERLRELGEPIADPYVVVSLSGDPAIERRLQLAAPEVGLERLQRSPLTKQVAEWRVSVFARRATPREWSYMAAVALDGEVTGLLRRLPPEAAGEPLDAAAALARAEAFLAEQGFDLALFEAPETRTQQLRARTDTTVRFRYRERLLGAEFPYGLEVSFGGDQLTGFRSFAEDPGEAEIRAALQTPIVFTYTRIVSLFVLLLVAAVPFLRRYHAGELGVRRGLQIMAVMFAASAVMMLVTARASTQGYDFGFLTRPQVTWVFTGQLILLYFLPLALLGLLSWSVGESLCRERWGRKLAAFDALFHFDLANATVARSALRGTAAGLALVGALFLGCVPLRAAGVWPLFDFNFGPWWPGTGWLGLTLFLSSFVFTLSGELFGRLFLLPPLVRRLGLWPGAAVAVIASAVFLWGAPLFVLPVLWAILMSALAAAAAVALFLIYDLLTVLLAALVASVASGAAPLLLAGDPWLQFQGSLALGLAALPCLLSLRHLASERQFEYRWEDVPPHVRRIAERERQRVELETARNIQSAILPELPPRLQGIDLAHAYLPATEVGGDFYDALALEDGRLAVAVGDVAGHGVSSGLVMSMAKSALAVQVTFDPAVEAVFSTLNRVVYQSARRRLLATLCYALIDPARREMLYASAGHLFPYRVGAEGAVEPLESISYPLGVRSELEITVRNARLGAGDTVVLFSDGVVEARAEDSEELFGFERLEQSLQSHAGKSPEALRDGVLDDLSRFTRDAPREDDLTLLVLRLPAA
jgi:hypothetical protein